MWGLLHNSSTLKASVCKHNQLFVVEMLHNISEKNLQNLRYGGTVVWQFVRLHTQTNSLYTDPPSTWQLTHFSLGCYFQMLHRDEKRERWRKWVKKRCRRKMREFRHLWRNEGLWYMVQQDSSCAVREVCVCVCACVCVHLPSAQPTTTNPCGLFIFKERIRSDRNKNKS